MVVAVQILHVSVEEGMEEDMPAAREVVVNLERRTDQRKLAQAARDQLREVRVKELFMVHGMAILVSLLIPSPPLKRKQCRNAGEQW